MASVLTSRRGSGRPGAESRWLCTPSRLAIAASLLVAGPLARAGDADDRAARIDFLRREAVSFEHGDGVARDPSRAIESYCRAARLGDAISAFDLGWIYANGRGVARDDALAARFFRIAADRGVAQAANMLRVVGAAEPEVPECMVEPAPAVPAAPVEPVRAFTMPPQVPKPIVELVTKIAPEYGVPLPLVVAVIEAESNYNSAAVSPRNAQGLMQLIPETAARFRVKNAFDPAQNVRGGVAYLRWLLAYFQGEVPLVAAAYNAGERAVERYRGVPPYEETKAYVNRIVAFVGSIAQPFNPSVAEPSPLLRQIRARAQTK